ncbi:class I SAM-dependent methyltransferase [Dactylosporangium sp. CA-139114]|uniref:class I SAM-dependent methyltransferase n=1 Tax=Dactylosporangium sp. CA-139114 TaxID=3239931 RepID=UPI003D998068
MDAQEWEERYRAQDRLFSGNPNGVLVTEAGALEPGRALDVGCGEGGDALWLADRGWRVTAVDIAPTALRRGAALDPGGRVTWTEADLNTSRPAAGAFDLVSVQYFPLRREAGDAALHGLLDAVAPGGLLLYVGHEVSEVPAGSGFRPEDYYHPADVAARLGPQWTILADETRPRTAPAPPGTHHRHDTVLLARFTPASAATS